MKSKFNFEIFNDGKKILLKNPENKKEDYFIIVIFQNP